ncbi:hypothetical protein AB7M17_005268 [Bradyrhizobium sp. USDA 377]
MTSKKQKAGAGAGVDLPVIDQASGSIEPENITAALQVNKIARSYLIGYALASAIAQLAFGVAR